MVNMHHINFGFNHFSFSIEFKNFQKFHWSPIKVASSIVKLIDLLKYNNNNLGIFGLDWSMGLGQGPILFLWDVLQIVEFTSARLDQPGYWVSFLRTGTCAVPQQQLNNLRRTGRRCLWLPWQTSPAQQLPQDKRQTSGHWRGEPATSRDVCERHHHVFSKPVFLFAALFLFVLRQIEARLSQILECVSFFAKSPADGVFPVTSSRSLVSTHHWCLRHSLSSTPPRCSSTWTAALSSRGMRIRSRGAPPWQASTHLWAAATRRQWTTRTRWTRVWVVPPVRRIPTTKTARPTAPTCQRPAACAATSRLMVRWGLNSTQNPAGSVPMPPPSTRHR